ncbi:centromere kinetochore component CENP-T-domain-containing protein [Dendryphion nanum]|uniref:Centromere kinetochore component CENP-T-domain-containing protein n=1 Tax=Dendryphion nanum TaxID=256645 RepID=A0A9P9I600_9PLEO|nr:centromere kinetochore component CENP-T-domain-containing protein [Dendryphion nanum]
MVESARKKQRVMPRESEVQDITEESTIYNNLRQLAGVIPNATTPRRRASSAGPVPTPGSRRTPTIAIRTPGTAVRTPRGGPATRPISARRAAPTTPHAIRALRERANAGKTPGQNRRRSGRVQRETPRDTLRDLSRLLARDTRPTEPTPQVSNRLPRNSALDLPDVDDGPDPVRPRFSMPLDDMYEDDSIHEAPPRQSLLPELPADVDNGTIQSLEFGRRAMSEDPRLYGGRVSERFSDLHELGIDGDDYEVDGTFINRRRTMDPDHLLDAIDEDMDDDTENRNMTGRRSDMDLGVFGQLDEEQDEPTFRFTIPQRMRAPQQGEGFEEVEEETESINMGVGQDETMLDELPDIVVPDEYEEGEAAEAAGGIEPVGWESEDESENDVDLQAYREEVSAIDRSLDTQSPDRTVTVQQKPRRQRREVKISRSGIEYPSFPAATVKRLAGNFTKSQGGKAKIGVDTLAALVETTDWFFEQMGEDLAAYAQHAGRKGIEEADVIAVMKRYATVYV